MPTTGCGREGLQASRGPFPPSLSSLVVIAHEAVEEADAPARGPALVDLVLGRAHGGAGDIEMSPGHIVDKALEQRRGGARPAEFFMSANLESIILSNSGPRGMRQTRSPVAFPARLSRSANSSLFENSPAYSCASATRIAPVRVARLTMNFGLNRSCTYQSTSASTRRPSASVLMISMV